MPRIAASIAILCALAALTACGGTSGPGSGGGSAETEAGTIGDADQQAPGLKNDPVYHEAGNICVNLPIDLLAQQYGVEPTPEAVADAVAADYPPADREKARAGCFDILKEGGQLGDG